MSGVELFNWYFAANVLIGVVALQTYAIMSFARATRAFRYRHLLWLSYASVLTAMVLPLAGIEVERELLPQTAQVWSTDPLSAKFLPAAVDAPTLHIMAAQVAVPLADVSMLVIIALLLGGAAVLFFVGRDWLLTMRIVRDAHLIRKQGRAFLLASEAIEVPFAFWSLGGSKIVVPSSLFERPRDLHMALRHEAQHHRQGDTRILYLLQALRAVCFWNPCAHLVVGWVRDLQEYACDEAMTERGRANAQEYCRCLIAMAESSLAGRMACRAGMSGKTLLNRRLSALLRGSRPPQNAAASLAVGAGALAMLAVCSIVVAAPIADRRVTREDAEIMAANVQRLEAFPVAVNERVVSELNRMLGTEDGRAAMQSALARMDEHREMVAKQLERYGLPQALLAVPLVESGYRNLPQGRDARHGAGIWMFIRSTARHFGLVVDDERDDRLDVAAETDAAMRMLSALHSRFGDWGLALLAYNAGERRVSEALRETGSRDVWELVRRGHENDVNYLPRVMAAILILGNPDALPREKPRTFRAPRGGIA